MYNKLVRFVDEDRDEGIVKKLDFEIYPGRIDVSLKVCETGGDEISDIYYVTLDVKKVRELAKTLIEVLCDWVIGG